MRTVICTGASTTTRSYGSTTHAPLGSATNLPVITDVYDTQWSVKMTNIKGNHTLKYGFNFNHVIYERPGVNNAQGQLPLPADSGRAAATPLRCKDWGSPIADMFLGWLHNINVREGINGPDWRQIAMGAFLQRRLEGDAEADDEHRGCAGRSTGWPWDVNDKMGSYVSRTQQDRPVERPQPSGQLQSVARGLRPCGPVPDSR